MAMNNSPLFLIRYQITHGQIDWRYTKIWINYNPLETSMSAKLKNIQSAKIKKSNFNYPTGNILQRNYPGLYPSGQINCTNCNSHKDTNAHIGLCPTHRDHIVTLLSKFKNKLIHLLLSENDSSFTFDIESRINASNLFKLLLDVLNSALIPDSSGCVLIPSEQPWMLLLHHLISQDLNAFFNNYFSKKRDRERFLIQYVTDFIAELSLLTWSSRSHSFKNWEKSLNITIKKKDLTVAKNALVTTTIIHMICHLQILASKNSTSLHQILSQCYFTIL
ncbi:hypothetical protein RhiirA5_386333 [Rhizophagus irregularis]|uniref:Uncharacterized protein n=1 Tax=Rhizophagus irregularis TaxID=588596 RepID=A0A2N0NK68_9GLOM|nr:hypothetical protein RhiirA5_386333 [Rhizophagus irregularis]